MSVAFSSPLSGKKRLFVEHEPSAEELTTLSGIKRARHRGPATGGCHWQANSLHRDFLFRLREMFPDLDEQAVAAVLANYGENLDAAIEKLNQLRITGAQTPDPSNQQDPQASGSGAQGCSGGCQKSGSDRLSPAWLETFLKEFYESRQHHEARNRVLHVLDAFETAVIEKYKTESDEMVAIRHEFEKLKKDNTILSKAVAVQHARLQEAAGKDQELQKLKEMLGQYQDKLRTLELNNYSLAMHLQRATDPGSGPTGGPPDVY